MLRAEESDEDTDYDDMPELGSDRPTSSEWVALSAIYDATGGGSAWTNATHWMSADRCTHHWHAVKCSESGNVTTLDLSANGLTGSIPSEIGLLFSPQSGGPYPGFSVTTRSPERFPLSWETYGRDGSL